MRSNSTSTRFGIRKLARYDLPAIICHFLDLDTQNRRARFGAFLHDKAVRTYAEHIFDGDSVIFGAFPDGQLRAVGELRSAAQFWRPDAEVALSVNPNWQEKGLGSALFARIVTAAQNRGVKSLHVLFLNENMQMRRITAKHHPAFECHSGEVEATLDPPWPTPFSIAEELMEDTSAYVQSLIRLTS